MAICRIGITGGIGSGKSVVSRLLELLGIPVYVCDTEAKRLMQTDAAIRRDLVALLGEDAYRDGCLNKPLLASYLFGHPAHAGQVNGIVHPRVRDDFRAWTLRQGDLPLVGMESAILIEAGFRAEVDKVVMVWAPAEVRIERAIRRDGASRAEVGKRILCQMDDDEKRRQADFLLVNDGQHPLIPQVLNLISSLSENH